MNRLEEVRAIVDRLLLKISDEERVRCGFIHLYGVSLTAVLLARRRGLLEDVAGTAGMLHDLVSYETGDPENHGPRSAARAAAILRSTGAFSGDEIQTIQSAIAHHSEKNKIHGPYEELLKDADVLQHDLYNPMLAPAPGHEERRTRLRRALT
jgi:HD superfamily phosphodiesterase